MNDLTTASQTVTALRNRDQAQAPRPNLPPVGRALFDELIVSESGTGVRVRFPFSALLRDLAAQAGCTRDARQPDCYRAVLIPLGRSLQRTAAAPQFFKYPRVVVAFTSDANHASQRALPLLKDRLYLGYQEKANVIEVISYNEQAGRFEFQLVKNYAAGQTPQIVYANRVVCVACHQNQAPIFSRQVWDETNANPAIAQRLAGERRDFYGLPINIGVDVANAIDDATDRSNLLATYQMLWRDGCAGTAAAARQCRAQALLAALQYRLTGERAFQQTSLPFVDGFVTPLERNWRARWAAGIDIASNDLPNRDPLQTADAEQLAHVAARFEALLPRGSKETWQWQTDRHRLIKGVGEFFSRAEIRAIATKLRINVSSANAGHGESPWNSRGFQALRNAVMQLVNDPVDRRVFDSPTIQHALLRDALFRRLAIAGSAGHRATTHAPSPPEFNDANASAGGPMPEDQALTPFFAHCGRCHATAESLPPNFLHGSTTEVQAKLRRCADRIYFRLSMARLPASQRPKTPMPPEIRLVPEAEPNRVDDAPRANMLNTVAPWISTDMNVPLEQLIGRSYEQLPSCAAH